MMGISFSAMADEVYEAGETIYYNILQMGLKVGEATLNYVGPQSYNGQDVVLIIFSAKGFNFYDEERIYLTPDSLKPVEILRDLNIFGHKEKIQEQYLPNQIKVTKTEGSKASEQIIDKKGDIDNIYAFIYRYRQSGDFKINDLLDIHLPTTDVKIKLTKETVIAAGGKKYKSYYMESDPAKYKLWFDASDSKLPLRISGSVGVANTSMVMTKYENN